MTLTTIQNSHCFFFLLQPKPRTQTWNHVQFIFAIIFPVFRVLCNSALVWCAHNVRKEWKSWCKSKFNEIWIKSFGACKLSLFYVQFFFIVIHPSEFRIFRWRRTKQFNSNNETIPFFVENFISFVVFFLIRLFEAKIGQKSQTMSVKPFFEITVSEWTWLWINCKFFSFWKPSKRSDESIMYIKHKCAWMKGDLMLRAANIAHSVKCLTGTYLSFKWEMHTMDIYKRILFEMCAIFPILLVNSWSKLHTLHWAFDALTLCNNAICTSCITVSSFRI